MWHTCCAGCLQGPNDASTVPLELSFMESYGSIAQHLWFGDNYILVGFRSGQVVVVSSLRCAACCSSGVDVILQHSSSHQ